MSDLDHDEYGNVYAFVSAEVENVEGSFSHDLGTFYRDNFDSFQAQFPEIDLRPDGYRNMRLVQTPVLEEAIRQFVGAEQ